MLALLDIDSSRLGLSLQLLGSERPDTVRCVVSRPARACMLNGPREGTRGVEESSNPSADAAMDRYASGDDSAFGELYDALCPRLYRYALGLVRNPTRAEDLVQQTLEKMLRCRAYFVKGSRVTPWAFAILRNQFRDQEKRPKIEVLSPDGINEDAFTSHPDPHACTETKQLELRLRKALDRLSPLQRQAFELMYYGEMSQAEIAEMLDTTVVGVKSRIQRAHEILRHALRAVDEGGLP